MQCLQLLDPPMRDAEVWRVELDLHAPAPEADWEVLSVDERARAARLHRCEDRVRFVRARAAARRLLARRLRCAPRAVRFAAGPHGKPRLEAPCEDLSDFNVSHAGRFALIAIARRGAIGVDIERLDVNVDAGSLEPHVLSRFERQLDADQQPTFHERWVVKEAVLKALGLGVAEHLQDFSVWKPPGAACRYSLRCIGTGWPHVDAWRVEAPPGYAAALAWAPTTALHACHE